MSEMTDKDLERAKDGKVDAIAALAMIVIVIVTALFWVSNQ